MRAVELKTLKSGDVFKRKPEAKTVFCRNHYAREIKRYSCIDYEDMNREIFLKGSTVVYIDFDF